MSEAMCGSVCDLQSFGVAKICYLVSSFRSPAPFFVCRKELRDAAQVASACLFLAVEGYSMQMSRRTQVLKTVEAQNTKGIVTLSQWPMVVRR